VKDKEIRIKKNCKSGGEEKDKGRKGGGGKGLKEGDI